jgi:CheY-like chemotaxis protein
LLSPEAIALQISTQRKHRLRILLVEDDPIDQQIALKMLRMMDHAVDLAKNGAEAVQAVGRVTYDLVVMDVQMPEMDGIQATRRVRCLYGNDLMVVFVTASSPDIYRDRCFEAGGNEFLCKPLKSEKLSSAINRVCRGINDGPADNESLICHEDQGETNGCHAERLP